MKTMFSSRERAVQNGSSTAIGGRFYERSRMLAILFSAVILTLGGARALGSDPVGIYALVDKVVFEPNDGTPERIQVWGVFALADGRGYTYAPAQRGFMYFKLKPAEEQVCRKEWKDLKSIAGTGQVVAFGGRHEEKGTVRKETAKAENPTVYPLGFGLTKLSKRAKEDYAPIKDLRSLEKAPPAIEKSAK
jgi:hypothetical protein